ncbi:MAG TPA: 16S rRNA (cytosine(1402)-N(4))-methyltransferase RsmH, partial [Gemmataceae bacterium]|nr:16S rRNA (cytosine(1402)-N(4))-methyltransferase RsmH [Gemmataceae bacterium]
MPSRERSTPAGEHRPVLLNEVVEHLRPQSGGVYVDTTVGWGGHAVELLRRAGPSGQLIGMDLDADNLSRAKERLAEVGHPFALHHGNFAGLQAILAGHGIDRVDGILADLGMSSMQIDAPERGFSYVRDGPLDMRMDRSRGQTAAELLARISEEELRQALLELADEPEAERIAAAIVAVRGHQPLQRTKELAQLIVDTLYPGHHGRWRIHPRRDEWKTHPAARTFQALRILVNRELANLRQLLRLLPASLRPGGRAVLIAFHSGEDRLIKAAFREGVRAGMYR